MLLVFALLLTFHTPVWTKIFESPFKNDESDFNFWLSNAHDDIEAANKIVPNFNVAKNIILFLGDGLGVTATTAGRIYKGQTKKGTSGEEEILTWEKFPNLGLIKTYNLDKQVADSAACATAFMTGAKGNYYTIGVSGRVHRRNCTEALDRTTWLPSVAQWAQEKGKDTGFLTTTRVSHATPAALYAHSAERKWECDTKIKDFGGAALGCKDIALQLVEDEPGKNINVIFAGGRNVMGAHKPESTYTSCRRTDGRNLAQEWQKDKHDRGFSTAYVTNTREFRNVNFRNKDFILGLFSEGHISYELDRDKTLDGVPSLKQMTEAAISRLSRHEKGFFLLVEGGRIDHGLHDNKAKKALHDILAFEESLDAALKMVNLEETLIIVTADHSHVMTINGYPERGNDILGKSSYDKVTDQLPHTTLMFTTGNSTNFTMWDGNEAARKDLSHIDTTHNEFMFPSLIGTSFGAETHGGEDVAAYAIGPMSHLIHRVHEQTFIAHVMAYAACIGPFKRCPRPTAKVSLNKYDITSYSSVLLPKFNFNFAVLFFVMLIHYYIF